MTRKELKMKILGRYPRIEDFADEIGYGRQQVSNIIRNKAIGRVGFWEAARRKLNMTYQEVWECITYGNVEGGNQNGKTD